MRYAVLAAALCLPCAPALAQPEVERLEIASEAASANFQAFAVARIPELAGTMTPFIWDDEMRAVGTCTLGILRRDGGDLAVSTYLAEMEAFAVTTVTSLEQFGEGPSRTLTNDLSWEIADTCNAIEVTMRLMEASGFAGVLTDPANVARLSAQ